MNRPWGRLVLFWLIAAAAILAVTQWAACRGEVPGYVQQCTAGGCRLAPCPATCRVSNALAGGTRYLGSGTLVDRDERHGLVVTCQHLFRGGTGTVTVTFPDGKAYGARVLNTDGPWDLSALLIDRPDAEPVGVAGHTPQQGETVWSCGYGPDGRYRVNQGQVTGYVRTDSTSSYETLELTGAARDGDSGGPVFNRQGELVAVLWGTDGWTVGGTYCGRVDRFLRETGRYLLPWNAQINDPGRDPRNRPPQVIVQPAAQPPVQPPVQPLAPAGPSAADLGPIQQRLANVEQAVAAHAEAIGKLQAVADAAAAKAEDNHKSLKELVSENGLVGGLKAKIEQRAEHFGIPAWLYAVLVGLGMTAVFAIVLVFVRKEEKRAASGEPILADKLGLPHAQEIRDLLTRMDQRHQRVEEAVQTAKDTAAAALKTAATVAAVAPKP